MQEFEQIVSELKKQKFAPVYFLMGEEPYFIDAIADLIENKILDESEKEFNQTVVYGKDTDVLSVISAAKRFPMMSERQVVIVKEAQNLKDLVGREKADDDGKSKHPFVVYLDNPQPSTILVFCYKYKTIDKRTSLAKAIAKKAVLFESKKLYDNKIPDWIEAYLRSKGYSIEPRAAAMLTEYLGNDLSKVANELDKLMINLPAKSEVTIEHIQANVGISKDYNTFELQAALGRKDVLKANKIVNYFAANEKDNPMVVTISTLYGYFSKLIIYHSLPDKSKMAVASGLGVNPFFVQDYERAARMYSLPKLRAIVNYLREYDLKSKGVDAGNIPQGELLKEMVFKILH
ncbi:MAG: DNA polymerase III subunit delta [Bacteroidetes bacterium]|nr:DNA polymerase III subunit delta [Bacteroidota bacterium]